MSVACIASRVFKLILCLGGHHADGHPKTGGLAGAVAPEQADDLAGTHREANVVDDGTAAVRLDQAFYL